MTEISPRAVLVAAALTAVLADGCCRAGKPVAVLPPAAAARPTTAEGCRACNGLWGPHGIAVEPSCNCRTHDGGKACRDGAACEGVCVAAEVPEREVVTAGPPPRGYFVGRCSDLVTVFGCGRFIDRGASARGPVALDDPPAAMCVD